MDGSSASMARTSASAAWPYKCVASSLSPLNLATSALEASFSLCWWCSSQVMVLHVPEKDLANAKANDCRHRWKGAVTSRRLAELRPQSSFGRGRGTLISAGYLQTDAMVEVGSWQPRTIDVEVRSRAGLGTAHCDKTVPQFYGGQCAGVRTSLGGIDLVGPRVSGSPFGWGPLHTGRSTLGTVMDVEVHRGNVMAIKAHASSLRVGRRKCRRKAGVSFGHAVDRQEASHRASSGRGREAGTRKSSARSDAIPRAAEAHGDARR